MYVRRVIQIHNRTQMQGPMSHEKLAISGLQLQTVLTKMEVFEFIHQIRHVYSPRV